MSVTVGMMGQYVFQGRRGTRKIQRMPHSAGYFGFCVMNSCSAGIRGDGMVLKRSVFVFGMSIFE